MTLTTADIITIIRISVEAGYTYGMNKATTLIQDSEEFPSTEALKKSISSEIANVTVEVSLDSRIQELLDRN